MSTFTWRCDHPRPPTPGGWLCSKCYAASAETLAVMRFHDDIVNLGDRQLRACSCSGCRDYLDSLRNVTDAEIAALKAENEMLRRKLHPDVLNDDSLEPLQRARDEWAKEATQRGERIAELEAENERLRTAMEHVLHAGNPPRDMSGQDVCEWLSDLLQEALDAAKGGE